MLLFRMQINHFSRDLLILLKVIDFMPTTEIDISQFQIPQNILLADINFP